MPSHVAPTTAEVYRAHLADASTSSDVFAAGLAEEPAAALVNALAGLDDPPTVRLLVTETVAKWLRRDFHLASTAADLLAAETLSLRVADGSFANQMVVTADAVASILSTDEQTAGPATDDPEFVDSMRERCSEAWETAEPFDLRTPPRSRVYETLGDEIDPAVEADYQAMLDAVETTRSNGYRTTDDDRFDEVELVLLAGAKHELQHYDLSRWGEDVGLASKATFSRTKNRLEDQGLLTTEKVPIDIGRPRQRLVLDDRLRDVEAGDLPEAGRDVIDSATE
ncbi:transcriptional regulator TbsP [Halococcus salifodinae]|uniref:Uncharacterized protein n=1 Tax=Halococcus salifodinae DSM 8989 TaxID=1227456 RepID=M0MQZ5_9EURY|nr:DUF5821 family protein [Halococcus salifodinae]EMA47778.1 hypothetical protein C450_20706 [Halococcus salifodinae DSM 8989]